MAILNHEHQLVELSYVYDQRYLSPEEKISLGFPPEGDIYTAAYCALDDCTAVKVINNNDNTPHIVDIPK